MKLISKISILGRLIDIFRADRMPRGYENAYGLYFIDERKIVIRDKMKKELRLEIFYHELFHAALDRAGINQTGTPNDMHEILCELFRNMIVDHFELKDKALKAKI